MEAANDAAAAAMGWTPAMGSFGVNTYPDSGGGGGSSSSGGGTVPQPIPTNPQGFNADAAQLAAQLADNAAQREYLNRRLALDSDIEAHRQAQQVWQNTYQQALFDYQKTQDTQQFGLQQAGVTGTYNGAPTQAAIEFQAQNTLAQQAQNNQAALGYLNLIGGMKGPQDYSQYLRTLGSTPGGIKDLVAASAGQYVPGRGATTGVAPVPASLGGMLNDVASGTSSGTSYADYMNATSSLPAPNQISPDAWNNFTTSQRQMLLGAYGANGYDTNDVLDLYKGSLPTYAGPTGSVKI